MPLVSRIVDGVNGNIYVCKLMLLHTRIPHSHNCELVLSSHTDILFNLNKYTTY